jgi:hypothetical protein
MDGVRSRGDERKLTAFVITGVLPIALTHVLARLDHIGIGLTLRGRKSPAAVILGIDPRIS